MEQSFCEGKVATDQSMVVMLIEVMQFFLLMSEKEIWNRVQLIIFSLNVAY